ncbi:MAG TPA: tail fiber domain-containing protein [Blastocatellia bacterium]|nr:tail fiber domain-containing protein [Blastocatellia bacterium]
MKVVKQFLALFLCVSLCVPMAQAAVVFDGQQDAQSAKSSQEDLTIIIQQEQVRFTARKAVTEMQLLISDQTGQIIFNSGIMAQQELAWAFRQDSGEAVKSGVYAYTLTVKEADAETSRVRRGHFIVDRAKERDNQTDRLWVTSQNDSSIGADLTVARNENAIIAGAAIPREGNTNEVATRDVVTRDIASDANAENKAALAAAASGTAGRIAKFTSTTNVGNSIMTEANNNIGIGGTTPLSKLHIFAATSDILPPRAQSASNNSFAAGWDFYHGTTGKGYVGVPGTATGIAPGEMLVYGSVNTSTSIWAGGVRGITVNPGGFVGIGTANTNAPYRLQVAEDFPAAEIGGAVYGVSLNNKGVLGQTTNGVGVMGLASDSGMAGHFVGKVGVQGDVFPTFDGYRLGTPTKRWAAVYAVNGTIQTSDARMKKGITNLRYGLSELMQLRPVSFQWKDDNNGQQHLGFIAQETQQVIPEAVVQPAEADSTLGMNYSTLIPVVIKSIQEQQGELETLKSDNDALQLRNADLKQQNANLETRLQAVEKLVKQLTGKKIASKAKN